VAELDSLPEHGQNLSEFSLNFCYAYFHLKVKKIFIFEELRDRIANFWPTVLSVAPMA